MDTEIQVHLQPFYHSSFTDRLSWLLHVSGMWAVGLPLCVDAESVKPPCYVLFQPIPLSCIAGGFIHQRIVPPLPVQRMVESLDSVDVKAAAQMFGVSEARVILVSQKAISFLCELSGIPIPPHDWATTQSPRSPLIGVQLIRIPKEG